MSLPADIEIFICFADIKRLFNKVKMKIFFTALACALLTFCYKSVQNPYYYAKATFKQFATVNSDQFVGLRSLFKGVDFPEGQGRTMSLMISKRIMRDAIQELGLQMHVNEKGAISRRWSNIRDNLSLEMGLSLSDKEPFVFSHVKYDEERPASYFLRFLNANTYEVFNNKKEFILKARLKERVAIENLEFVLEKTPKHLSLKKFYPLTIEPWNPLVESCLRNFEISSNNLDKNILLLGFRDPDRHLAAAFINQVMVSYQKYLKEEDEKVTSSQLAYLEKRQNELAHELDRTLEEHVVYLKKNFGEKGFIGLQQEIEMLSGPIEEYTAKLFDIDLSLKRMEKVKEDRIAAVVQKEKMEGIDDLSSANLAKPFQNRLCSLEFIQKNESKPELNIEKAKLLLECGNSGQDTDVRANFNDFHSLSLETAERLYIEYNNQLDGIQANIRQLVFIREHMQESDFEISSLSTILGDPVTQEMVQKAGVLALGLRDELNHSSEEHDRIKEELGAQKKFIYQHIGQSIDMHKVRAKLVEDKIASLQEVCIDLIKNEKVLLEGKLEELSLKMSDLPEKWRLENQLKFKAKLSSSIIEGMTKLVESKSVNHHLFQIESTPLDVAVPPLMPKKPRLFVFALVGAFMASLSLFAFYLFHAMSKGLPVTLEGLRILGQPTCGKLSKRASNTLNELKDEDLETLRKISNFIKNSRSDKGICAALVGSGELNYSPTLASLLALQELKVLLIHCDFRTIAEVETKPGLLQYLNGEIAICPIQTGDKFDFLTSGEVLRHAVEVLSKLKFETLLDDLRQRYDVILIYCPTPLGYAETQVFVNCSDSTVISLQEESLEEIKSYTLLHGKKKSYSMSFIVQD